MRASEGGEFNSFPFTRSVIGETMKPHVSDVSPLAQIFFLMLADSESCTDQF